ncbi:MAG: biotin--[acetyl-CoA-carboxylase] ligase [bacterium]
MRSHTLNAERLQERLSPCRFARKVMAFDSIDSTNTFAMKLFGGKVAEDTLVIAERQTAGRGRFARKWEGAAGKSLLFSLPLCPSAPSAVWSFLPMATAVAIAEALDEFRLAESAGIKWPNDVTVRGKKICGILSETASRKRKQVGVVLGVGVNVNQVEEDFPAELRASATSVRIESQSEEVDRIALLRALLLRFEEDYELFNAGEMGREALRKLWRQRSTTLGKHLSMKVGGRTLRGTALDLDLEGALLFQVAGGAPQRLTAGEVEELKWEE